MTRIIVWKGKHDTSYFDASTDEKQAKSALYLMELMDQEGYYWEPEDPRLSKYHPIYDGEDLTDEQIEGLPTEGLRDAATKARAKYRNAMTSWKADHAQWEEGQRILREKDASVNVVKFESKVKPGTFKTRTVIPAWDFIYARSDYEYEGVYLKDLIDKE